MEALVDQKHHSKVFKLKICIYGLKKESRNWNHHFDDEITKYGFGINKDKSCVYMKTS